MRLNKIHFKSRPGYMLETTAFTMLVIIGLLVALLADRFAVKLGMDTVDILRQDASERLFLTESARATMDELLGLRASSPESGKAFVGTDALQRFALNAGTTTAARPTMMPGVVAVSATSSTVINSYRNSAVMTPDAGLGATEDVNHWWYSNIGADGIWKTSIFPTDPVLFTGKEAVFTARRFISDTSPFAREHEIRISTVLVPVTNFQIVAYSLPSVHSELKSAPSFDALGFPAPESSINRSICLSTMDPSSEGSLVIMPGHNLALSTTGLPPEYRFDQDVAWHYFDWLFTSAARDPLLTSGLGLSALVKGSFGLPKDTSSGAPANRYILDPTRLNGNRYYIDAAGAEILITTPDRSAESTNDARINTDSQLASLVWINGNGTGKVIFDRSHNGDQSLLLVVDNLNLSVNSSSVLHGGLLVGPHTTYMTHAPALLDIYGILALPATARNFSCIHALHPHSYRPEYNYKTKVNLAPLLPPQALFPAFAKTTAIPANN